MLRIENLNEVRSLDKDAMDAVRGGLVSRTTSQLYKASKSGSLRIGSSAYYAFMVESTLF